MTTTSSPLSLYVSGAIAIPLTLIIGAIIFTVTLQKDGQVMAKDLIALEKRICENETLDQNQRASIDKLTILLDQIAQDTKEIKQNTRR